MVERAADVTAQLLGRADGREERDHDHAAIAARELRPRPEIAEHVVDGERAERAVASHHRGGRASRIVRTAAECAQEIDAAFAAFFLRAHLPPPYCLVVENI